MAAKDQSLLVGTKTCCTKNAIDTLSGSNVHKPAASATVKGLKS